MEKLCECGCGRPTPLARQNHTERGWVKGQPLRFIQGHSGSGNRPPVVFAGERYGRMVVVGEVGRDSRGSRVYECVCDCGAHLELAAYRLRSGNVQSCGCLARDLSTKHGMAGTSAYSSWKAMMGRCLNPKHRNYEQYRHRAPCERMRSVEGFYAVLGERPASTSIDRIDNDGGYWCGDCGECRTNGWPMNVRWATASEQNRNQRPRRRRNSKA